MSFWCQCEVCKYFVTCEQLNWFVCWWKCTNVSIRWYLLYCNLPSSKWNIDWNANIVIRMGKRKKEDALHLHMEIWNTWLLCINNVGTTSVLKWCLKWISLGRFKCKFKKTNPHGNLSRKNNLTEFKGWDASRWRRIIIFSSCLCALCFNSNPNQQSSWTVKKKYWSSAKGVKLGHLYRHTVCIGDVKWYLILNNNAKLVHRPFFILWEISTRNKTHQTISSHFRSESLCVRNVYVCVI